MKNLNITIFLGILLLMSSVIAQPPFEENIGTTQGLQLFEPQFEAVKYNTTFNLHLHVSNITSGLQLDNSLVDCTIHIYGATGSHLLEIPLEKDSNGVDHEIQILHGNFTEAGSLNAYYIWCNSTDVGGETKGTYEITANGKHTPEGIVIVMFSLILILLTGSIIYLMIRLLALFVEKSVGIQDVAYMWGIYFVIQMYGLLAYTYWGNVQLQIWIDNYATWLGIPLIIIPILAFFISLIAQKKEEKEQKAKW